MKGTVLILILVFTSLSLCAQKSEFKKVMKSGPTVETLENFLKSYPDFPIAHIKLGDKYHLKEPELAVKYYEKAMDLVTQEDIDDYESFYEEFERRDLRSGKMVIRLNDVKDYLTERIEKNRSQ